jgi:filamentous hemagglutinin family protein
MGFASQWVAAAPAPETLPSGEQVTAGAANIGRDGRVMTITQKTERLITEWQDFSIGRDAHVEFVQPGVDSSALNRVVGSKPSEIFGSLSANGQVVLVNQAGIHFGNGSQINAGSLVASTLDIADEDFLADQMRFAGSGAGTITADGEINVAEGGYVAMVAPTIEQRGTIEAPSGNVALAAAEAVELTLGNTGLVSFKVERGAYDAAIDNAGVIDVGDGAVVLTAEGFDELTRGAVNNSGTIEASGLTAEGGRIVLEADGQITHSGRIAADSQTDDGGRITVEADDIHLQAGSQISAQGATGGGDVLVGGDWQGGANEERRVLDSANAMAEATTVKMDAGATIDASGTDTGDGGRHGGVVE